MVTVMSKQEFDWRAESDGRTLINAEEIKNDPERLDRAQEYIEAQRNAMGAALGVKPTGTTPSRRRRNSATVGTIPVPN